MLVTKAGLGSYCTLLGSVLDYPRKNVTYWRISNTCLLRLPFPTLHPSVLSLQRFCRSAGLGQNFWANVGSSLSWKFIPETRSLYLENRASAGTLKNGLIELEQIVWHFPSGLLLLCVEQRGNQLLFVVVKAWKGIFVNEISCASLSFLVVRLISSTNSDQYFWKVGMGLMSPCLASPSRPGGSHG